tara:strand:+ start:7083 stop:8042 length:960 start_codon:yes stop_codon:yes gene_type:complete
MKEGAMVDCGLRSLLDNKRAQIRRPDPAVSIDKYRHFLDAPLAMLSGCPIEEVSDIEIDAPTGRVAARLYRPSPRGGAAPFALFFHGGGFVAGSLDTHDALCRKLARLSGIHILSVSYRLAPEHPHPAALQDCMAVLAWLAAHGRELGLDPDRVAICGDSAGGYLAVLAALDVRRNGLALDLRFLGLIYPVVDPSCNSASMQELAEGYLLTRDAMQWFWEAFSGTRPEAAAVPSLLAEDLSDLPPTLILTAEFDPLRDEGAALAECLAQAEVDATLHCYPGMIHGFVSLPHLTFVASSAVQKLGDALSAHLTMTSLSVD